MFVDLNKAMLVVALAGASIALAVLPAYARESTAAILRHGPMGEDAALSGALTAELKAAGYAVTDIDTRALCNASQLSAERFDLLVLPDAGPLPAKSMPSIDKYLRRGGDLIALNAPMWQRALLEIDGHWITRDEWRAGKASVPPSHVVFDFTPDDIVGWRRGSDDVSHPTVHETTSDGPGQGQRALHVTIPELTSYDTFGSGEVSDPFPNGSTLTVFAAKGGPNTTQLSVEWDEKDGSRWIAIVPLTQEWRQYVLAPGEFRYWQSNPKRGFRGDRFDPANAVAMSVGLAFTHTTAVGSGPHEYWVGPFGTAKVTPELKEILDAYDPPALDALSPSYKLFESRGAAKLAVRDDQVIVDQAALTVPKVVRSVQPRPRGGGFDKGRDWRFIPLIEARSADGQWRGFPAAMTVNVGGPYAKSVWASFGVGDAKWYSSPAALKMIGQVARKMRDGVFIVDGGSDFYTFFPEQALKLGVRVANVGGPSARGLETRVSVTEASGKRAESKLWGVDIDPGDTKAASETWKPAGWPRDGFTVTAEILSGGKVIDRVVHDAYLSTPKKTKHFVTAKDGNFVLDGKRWRAHGVNYMPSSGIGTEDGEYFEHWLGARAYDPEVIQRDLEHCKDLGFNSISVFIYHGHHLAQNLLDLLRRAEELGLKVNLSLRPGTPMEFLWLQIGEIIQYYRLWENDTVFAYDLAWEPMFGTREDRAKWDGEWENWIVERYGNIGAAEADWGYKVPRDESGKVTNPAPHEIDTDGDWRKMTAAYRRFLDFLLYKKYGEARRLVRSIDPNHLVSFRMAEAANPNYRWGGRLPYDFPYLAAAVDFLAPEAYGRIGPWERVKPGWFQTTYARWAAPEKPIIWAESGSSTWDTSRMANSPARLKYAADSYRNMYRLLIETGADGIFHWWYPGGFRVGENSDYGVIEPDGTDREVTKVIRELGPKFLAGPDPKPVDHWITFDRDKHPDGIAGVYDQHKDEFWKAIGDGKTPGLRTEGTGTDSGTCPMRYLDGAIDRVQVKGVDGKWVTVAKGGSAEIAADKPVMLRVALTNLGEAEWLPSSARKVRLLVEGDLLCEMALPSRVPHLGSIEVTMGQEPQEIRNLLAPPPSPKRRMTGPKQATLVLARGDRFGERFPITLIPVDKQ